MIDNATFMARTEFEVLDRAPDWGFLQHAADRVRFIFTKDDHWGPMWMYDKVSIIACYNEKYVILDACFCIGKEDHTVTMC